MGRQCSFPGCKNTSGLHSFPADLKIRRQWLRALGLPDRELPLRAGVCNSHFSRDCFSNLMEVDMGFTKVLMLKGDAVPNVSLPVTTARPPAQQMTSAMPRHIQPKPIREMGCQTDRVSTKHAAGQADIKPYHRSKATQTQGPNRGLWRDMSQTAALPEGLATPEEPRGSSPEITDDSSDEPDEPGRSANRTGSSNVSPPHKKVVVHEDKLMELFTRCPFCTRRCVVSKTASGGRLHVEQSCAHCDHARRWSSQPPRWSAEGDLDGDADADSADEKQSCDERPEPSGDSDSELGPAAGDFLPVVVKCETVDEPVSRQPADGSQDRASSVQVKAEAEMLPVKTEQSGFFSQSTVCQDRGFQSPSPQALASTAGSNGKDQNLSGTSFEPKRILNVWRTRRIVCLVCNRVFPRLSHLEEHKSTHKPFRSVRHLRRSWTAAERRLTCKFCRKMFSSQDNCLRHQRVHSRGAGAHRCCRHTH
ncbi:uncharacterized protein ACBR49_011589 [Aulostomus maculatus]